MGTVDSERSIRQVVKSTVTSYACGFSDRHIGEVEDPNGVINMKIHNVFIAVLGEELQYYAALVRSFDSSFGNMLERMAINIAELFYDVYDHVEGPLFPEQTAKIAELLEAYRDNSNPMTPSPLDYRKLLEVDVPAREITKRHESDYYLVAPETGDHFLIELKIGGDLDNKKARAEKEALFEQYAILSNTLGGDVNVNCYFATAYNRFGEGKEWKQGRVLKYFSKEELLIGRDFWDFVCQREDGYRIVMDEYKKNAGAIKDALHHIKEVYLQ